MNISNVWKEELWFFRMFIIPLSLTFNRRRYYLNMRVIYRMPSYEYEESPNIYDYWKNYCWSTWISFI
jgi:hypothetical protein